MQDLIVILQSFHPKEDCTKSVCVTYFFQVQFSNVKWFKLTLLLLQMPLGLGMTGMTKQYDDAGESLASET